MGNPDFVHQLKTANNYLGKNFSALMCGLQTSEMEDWETGEFDATRAQKDTIHSFFRLWKMLRHYDKDTVKFWLTAENPRLNNVWPLMVIARYPNDVYRLAQQWIENGEKTFAKIS